MRWLNCLLLRMQIAMVGNQIERLLADLGDEPSRYTEDAERELLHMLEIHDDLMHGLELLSGRAV